MNLKEQLEKLNKLKLQAQKEEAEFKAGKRDSAPAISSKEIEQTEGIVRNINGDFSSGRVNIKEAFTSTNAIKLIPKVIEGQMREAAEPVYLATKYMHVINVDPNNSSYVYVVPAIGEITASEIAEGGRYPEAYPDMNTFENSMIEIKTKKIGLKMSITEEAIMDSAWDVIGIMTRKMGRALARYKETWCFNNFSDHGWVIIDNALRDQAPEAGSTGRAADGTYNDTLSTEDFLDMVLALMGQDKNPTTVIMHPLTWVVFARNSMIGNGLTYGAFGGSRVHPWGATQGTPGYAGLPAEQGPQKLIMRPEQVQDRLPIPIEIEFSPFVRFDKVNKKFDMYIIDKNDVGTIIQKQGISTEEWTDPERDIRALKAFERYGIGINDNGRGIGVCRNISVDTTYPEPPTVRIITESE